MRSRPQIERLVDSDPPRRLALSPDVGRAKRIEGAQARYIEFAKCSAAEKSGIRRAAHRDRLRERRRLQASRPRPYGSLAPM